MNKLFVFILFIFSTSLFAAKAPIIFVHGFGITGGFYDTFTQIQKLAQENGHELFMARSPAFGDLEIRVKDLQKEIRKFVPNGPFHLVSHSMGGIDCRLLIARDPQLASRMLSLTTLSSPHHGSLMADWLVGQRKGPVEQDRTVWETVLKYVFGNNWEGVEELTTENMEKNFNPTVLDNPNIKYFSMSFYTEGSPFLVSPLPWVAPVILIHERLGEGPNDGVVAVERSKWGVSLGTFQGDHWAETAPFPYRGHIIYKTIFQRVFTNIDENFI